MKQHGGSIRTTAIIVILVLLIGGGVVYALIFGYRFLPTRIGENRTASAPSGPVASVSSDEQAPASYKRIVAKDIHGYAGAFRFAAAIPASWAVEAIPQSNALNVYDPAADGQTNIEKSQIFIKFFRANSFLTLSTVNVLERRPQIIRGRQSVSYVIEKKSGVANFQGQPLWRNVKHRVTDIREAEEKPAIFYVFAKRPDLSDDVFDEFLQSLVFDGDTSALFYPIANFLTGVTKKPFGIFVSAKNSPVQPERFSGYHTGVDVEPPADYGDQTIPAFAMGDGIAVLSQSASGYGGVLAIRHPVGGEQLLAVYGHLNPQSMVSAGTRVYGGERIGVLGKGFSSETDFERRHLHFGLYRGSDVDIRGYVKNKSDLKQWLDPAEFFKTAPAPARIPQG